MLRHILFDVSFFENESDRSNSQKRVLFLLHALTNCNRLYLREHPDTPLIYKSGIVYKVPAQFEQEDVPEVGKVVKYLKSIGAPSDVMSAMTQLSRMCGGGEHFREIPRIIENGGGDCFPTGTRVLARDGSLVPVELLKVGDEIWGRHRWSTVKAVWKKEEKLPTRQFNVLEGEHHDFTAFLKTLPDGSKLPTKSFEVTADHKLFVIERSGHVVRVRAEEVRPGTMLIAPKTPREIAGQFSPDYEFSFANFNADLDEVRTVFCVGSHLPGERGEFKEVWDLTTDDHYVYLPDADVTVSQCDNVACWRAAELCEMGIPARPYITWRQRPDGGTTYHVVVRYDADGSSEDPSLLLGMGGEDRAPDRKEEERKLGERLGDFLNADFKTTFGTLDRFARSRR